ncbi:MAG: enoyl-CoA hydratase [Rhodospirillaceae bacterium]|nr:enoyl-CoA hydratase [Rhodospirillaceae bacterium]
MAKKKAKEILTERSKNVLTITLNRPEVLNAVNGPLTEQLFEELAAVENDARIRCVVIRGGNGHFMAGGDLKLFHGELDRESDERRRFFEKFVYQVHPLIQVIKRLPKPVVASVEGAAGGFGVSLMLACDLVIAADTSFYTMAYCSIGTSPDGSSTYFLPRSVGLKKAMELALLCDRFDAETAKGYGMVNWVVPENDLAAETAKLANRLASGPTKAYGNTKRLLNNSLHSTLDDQLQAEAESFSQCAGSGDFVEGINAFVEKRKARFKGK